MSEERNDSEETPAPGETQEPEKTPEPPDPLRRRRFVMGIVMGVALLPGLAVLQICCSLLISSAPGRSFPWLVFSGAALLGVTPLVVLLVRGPRAPLLRGFVLGVGVTALSGIVLTGLLMGVCGIVTR